MAIYDICALHFQAVKQRSTLFTLQFGAAMSICTLPDTRIAGHTVMFAATALVLLITEYVLTFNMRLKQASDGIPGNQYR